MTDKLKLKVSPKDTKAIKLIKGDVDVPAKGGQRFAGADEWYSLVVDPSKELITITGKGPAGVFYGVQTLLALRNSKGRVPKVSIKDAPRYSYRGMHLDVARNFKAKEYVFKLLDAMAMYKLNKFHFHLTDDEGWRLEIPGLPELTKVKLFRLCFQPGRRGGLMVSAFVAGSSGPGSSPGRGHCVVFLGKTLNSHSVSLHPGV